MNAAHYHLILNHIPILATFFSIAVLIWGMVANNKSIKLVALVGFIVAGISVIAVFQTGESAEEIVEEIAAVTHESIENHEEAADVAQWLTIILGAGGLAGLVMLAKSVKGLSRFLWVLLVYAIVTATSLAYTANLGGEIRHSEILESTETTQSANLQDNNDRVPDL